MTSILDRITVNPAICHGKPCIRNKRYPVEVILEYLAGGDTFETLKEEFADLEKEDILACIEYAATVSKIKGIYYPPAA